MATWLHKINMTELSAVKRPANRKRKLHQKAEWSAQFVNGLPDSSFLYVAPGGEKDSEGKTTPRRLRYFPVRDADGKVDLPHLRNALARIPQANLPAAVKDAAKAKARRLLEQQTKSTEEQMWISDENLTEYFAKASMPDLQKQAIKAAVAALNAAKAEMDPGMFKAAKAAMAKLLGFGATQKSVDDAEAKAVELEKSAETAKEKTEGVIKYALDKLQADKPAINEAVAGLADLVGVTPQFKRLEQLPEDLKAEWEAMQKSQEQDRAELAELKKSMAEAEAKVERARYVTKAQEIGDLPIDADKLGHLLHAVAKSEDSDAAATLDQLLKSMAEVTKQSALFTEMGGSGNLPPDRGGVFGKIDALAEEMMTKSESPITIEQARTRILENNPDLYDRYNAQP